MSAQLVADSGSIETARSEFDALLRGYSYNPGKRYAEFRQGDKLAGYGLTALIAGGVGAAAGVYFARVEFEGEQVSQKIVVLR